MLTHPTLDQLRALKLDGMVQAFVELEAQEQATQFRPRRMVGFVTRWRGRRSQHQTLPNQTAHRTAASQGSTKRYSSSWRPLAGSRITAIFLSPVPAASANRGCPVRWPKRLAGMAIASTTRACRACSPILISPTATVASRACSECWSRSISRCLTIGDLIASPRAVGAISWRSSRIATAVAPS